MESVLLAAVLVAGTPQGWEALPTRSITAQHLQCANWSRDSWILHVSGESVRPVRATQDLRQDALPFPVSFRGAIPFPGDLPEHKEPVPKLDWQVPPEYEAAVAELESQPSPEHVAWALKYGESHARRYVVQVNGGWLIGYGGGEFGGSLWWYSEPGPGRRLGDGNIVELIPVAHAREALVFAGLSHMGIDQGRVFRFTATGKPELQLVTDLEAAPQVAIAETDESALVLTTRRLWRVPARGPAQGLCALDSQYLYPRSMARLASGDVWVGMRHFVVRLQPKAGGDCDVQWFTPADCSNLVRHGEGECTCRR